MNEVTFEHRCRRCGGVVSGSQTSLEHAQNGLMPRLLYSEVRGGNGMEPRMVESHACPDGGCGVTDFIGYRVEVERAKHEWKGAWGSGDPAESGSREWQVHCGSCGVEVDDDNEHGSCPGATKSEGK